jgi:hypothetical protein
LCFNNWICNECKNLLGSENEGTSRITWTRDANHFHLSFSSSIFCKNLFKTCSNFFLILLKGILPNVFLPLLFVRCFKTISYIFLDFVRIESKIQGTLLKYTQFQCVWIILNVNFEVCVCYLLLDYVSYISCRKSSIFVLAFLHPI